MVKNVLGIDAMQSVRNPHELRAKHQGMLARQRSRGIDAHEHIVTTHLFARIEHGRWIADCACGSGVNVQPGWPEARCLGCGAVYSDVVFPLNRAAIEAVLVKRPGLANRNWWPSESLEDLERENDAHGVR
jgi:hypothetical protein